MNGKVIGRCFFVFASRNPASGATASAQHRPPSRRRTARSAAPPRAASPRRSAPTRRRPMLLPMMTKRAKFRVRRAAVTVGRYCGVCDRLLSHDLGPLSFFRRDRVYALCFAVVSFRLAIDWRLFVPEGGVVVCNTRTTYEAATPSNKLSVPRHKSRLSRANHLGLI